MIKMENGKYRYFDRNGKEIVAGCTIRYASGRERIVYACTSYVINEELGTDATNPAWIASGRAQPCEYGIYPLTRDETEEVEVVE